MVPGTGTEDNDVVIDSLLLSFLREGLATRLAMLTAKNVTSKRVEACCWLCRLNLSLYCCECEVWAGFGVGG